MLGWNLATPLQNMTSITIQNLNPDLTLKLQQRAERNGRSLAEEAEIILALALTVEPVLTPLGERIHQRFQAVGGWELGDIERPQIPDPPIFAPDQ